MPRALDDSLGIDPTRPTRPDQRSNDQTAAQEAATNTAECLASRGRSQAARAHPEATKDFINENARSCRLVANRNPVRRAASLAPAYDLKERPGRRLVRRQLDCESTPLLKDIRRLAQRHRSVLAKGRCARCAP